MGLAGCETLQAPGRHSILLQTFHNLAVGLLSWAKTLSHEAPGQHNSGMDELFSLTGRPLDEHGKLLEFDTAKQASDGLKIDYSHADNELKQGRELCPALPMNLDQGQSRIISKMTSLRQQHADQKHPPEKPTSEMEGDAPALACGSATRFARCSLSRTAATVGKSSLLISCGLNRVPSRLVCLGWYKACTTSNLSGLAAQTLWNVDCNAWLYKQ